MILNNPCKVIFNIPIEASGVSCDEVDSKPSTLLEAPVYIYTVLKRSTQVRSHSSRGIGSGNVWGHVTTLAIISQQSDSGVQCQSN